MLKGPRWAFVLGAMLVVVSGCPRALPPLDFGLRGRIQDPQEALDALQAQAARVHTVRGEAKAKVDSAEGSGSLTQFVIAQTPNRVRLESVDFFGRPVAVLASNGVRGSLFDLDQNVVYEGPATAHMVSRLLPLEIEPTALVSLLLGAAPLSKDALALSLEVDEVERVYVLVVSEGGELRRIGFDTASLHPVWIAAAGWRATFAGWKAGALLPEKVTLSSADRHTKVVLAWRENEINVDVEPEVFEVEVPDGVPVRAL